MGSLVGCVYGLQSWTRLKQLSSSSRLVITFLPRSKCLLISWLQSPSAVILEPRKIKSDTVSPSIGLVNQTINTLKLSTSVYQNIQIRD